MGLWLPVSEGEKEDAPFEINSPQRSYKIQDVLEFHAVLCFRFKLIRTLECSVIDLWLGNAALQWQLTRITFYPQTSWRNKTDCAEEKENVVQRQQELNQPKDIEV